jgi:hypothetical protein
MTTADFAILETFYASLWGFILGALIGIAMRALMGSGDE